MKSFVSSLLIFALLLGGMILNYHYINDTCDTLAARIDALPPCGEAEDAILALGAFWETHKGKIWAEAREGHNAFLVQLTVIPQ